MAKTPPAEDQVLDDTPEEVKIDEAEELQQESGDDEEEAAPAEPEPDEGDDEVLIGFEDEAEEEAAEDDTPTIRRLRDRNREQTKLLRDREKRIAELEQTAVKPKIEVGPKPDLWEDCEGDPEKFETALDKWKADKAEADSQVTRAEEQSRRVIDSYNRDLEAYTARKAAIGVPDYEEAEATVVAALSMEQQAVALQSANDPAALVVALAKSPAKLAELAKIDNPWKLSAAIARMEGSVKVTTRKKASALDRPATGSASMQTANADAELERLEKEAEKTGDRSKVQRYKRSLKEKK